MKLDRVRFGVDVARETDMEVRKLACLEGRSKRNFHSVLLNRLVRLWKEKPDELRELGLIRTEQPR